MAKRRTAADQERIREKVKAAMAEPRGEPTFPKPYLMAENAAAPVSSCCGAAVRIRGDSFGEGTCCHVCVKCERMCDAR